MAINSKYPQDRVQLRDDGNLAIPNGKHIDIETGGKLTINDVDKTAALAAAVANPLAGLSAGLKIASGQATTVTASDTVATGLTTVLYAVASLEDTPVLGCDRSQAVVGNQAGAPAAGSILLKTFCPTATGDATPKAATTFGKKVNWIAIGS